MSKVPRETRFCKCECGETFECRVTESRQFVDRDHYLSWRKNNPETNPGRANKGKPAWNRLPRETRICKKPSCDITFEVSIHSTKRYCSRKCARKCQKRNKHSKETKQKIQKSILVYWQNIEASGKYPREFNKELKTFIRERDDNTCQLCGRTKEQEGRNLTVHHINYNKQNCDPKNLVTLCSKCNPKVNYHRKNWAFELLFDKLFENEITNEEAIFAFARIL